LLALAVLRIVAGVVAIPIAPVLYREHFLVLVLLRPTKEVLLFGGFLARQDKVHLLQILIAAVPLSILGVWHAFALGRGYAREIGSGHLPKWTSKLLSVDKVKQMQKALRKKGTKLVFLGRLAVFPSSVVGMAAGSSKMKASTFLLADAIGGALSIAAVLGAGFGLGAAYKSGKAWVTAFGVAALIGMGVLVGRYLRRE
jgi:membrane-associated protein